MFSTIKGAYAQSTIRLHTLHVIHICDCLRIRDVEVSFIKLITLYI